MNSTYVTFIFALSAAFSATRMLKDKDISFGPKNEMDYKAFSNSLIENNGTGARNLFMLINQLLNLQIESLELPNELPLMEPKLSPSLQNPLWTIGYILHNFRIFKLNRNLEV